MKRVFVGVVIGYLVCASVVTSCHPGSIVRVQTLDGVKLGVCR